MSRLFRVIDTGLRGCREQIAFDQALIDAHKAGEIGDTVRFLQFPPSVLVGRHQIISQELNLPACRAAGVGIGRRITGGGALYLDEGQFGWELVFHRNTLGLGGLGEVAQAICEAAADGLSRLGIDARFRPRNDIEVEGRKISGTGGFFDGDTIFYQGTVLLDMDVGKMTSLLNIPAAKLARHAQQDARQRVVTLRELQGGVMPDAERVKQALLKGFEDRLGIGMRIETISAMEESRARDCFDEEIGRDDFVYEIDDPTHDAAVRSATVDTPGGRISAHLRLEGSLQNRIREVLITGDFFVTPPNTVLNLEAALRGVLLTEVPATVAHFFASNPTGLLSSPPSEFANVILRAAENTQS